MQSLWSRARTISSSCRCSLCHPPRAPVPRRSNAAIPGRRRHGVNDALTIFYGTIMAAALFTDASHKIGRKVRLEAAIEEEVLEAARLEQSNLERLAALAQRKNGFSELGVLDAAHVGQSNAEKLATQERGTSRLSELEVRQVQSQPATLTSRTHKTDSATRRQQIASQAWLEHATRDQRALEERTDGCQSEFPASTEDLHIDDFDDLSSSKGLILDLDRTLGANDLWHELSGTELDLTVDPFLAPYWSGRFLSRSIYVHEISHYQLLCEEQQEHVPLQSWAPSTDSWPVGRSPQELWHTALFFSRSIYSCKLLEYAVSRLICEAIKDHLLGDKYRPAVTLGELIDVFEDHPAFEDKLSAQSLNEHIQRQTVSILDMRELQDHRDMAKMLPKPRFTAFAKHRAPENAGSDDPRRVRRLNDTICDAFAMPKTSTEILARVLGILASTDIMPNAHTFNIMLTNFPRIGIDMNRSLIRLMQACGLPITEIGLAAMLQTSAASRPTEFDDLARKMNAHATVRKTLQHVGLGNDELAKMYPELLTGELNYVRPSDAPDVPEHHYWQIMREPKKPTAMMRSPINHELYEALILGYLDTDPDIALRFLTRMENSGLTMNAKILNGLLYSHIRAGSASKLTGARSCDRLQNDLCAGQFHGSPAALTEAVYLFRHIWTDEEVPNTDKLNKLHDYAVRARLISPMSASNFNGRAELDPNLLRDGPRILRLLERPILHFCFSGSRGVQNLTKMKTDILWTGKQPSSLEEFLRARIAILHDEYARDHGTHPVFQTTAQKQADRDEFLKARIRSKKDEPFVSPNADDDAETSLLGEMNKPYVYERYYEEEDFWDEEEVARMRMGPSEDELYVPRLAEDDADTSQPQTTLIPNLHEQNYWDYSDEEQLPLAEPQLA